MDDQGRKILTEWLLPTNSRCEFLPYPKDNLLDDSSPLTMMALKDKLVEDFDDMAFEEYCYLKWEPTKGKSLLDWLLNPERFFSAVLEFKRREYKGISR